MKQIIFFCAAVFAVALSVPSPACAETSAKPAQSCVNLTGTYVVPLGKHDRSNDPRLIMIDQDQCRLINLVIGYGGFIPISRDYSLDGSEGYSIAGDTIVQKGQGGDLAIPTVHGDCSANSIAMSLDANKNLVISSKKVFGCDDHYRGVLAQTYLRAVRH